MALFFLFTLAKNNFIAVSQKFRDILEILLSQTNQCSFVESLCCHARFRASFRIACDLKCRLPKINCFALIKTLVAHHVVCSFCGKAFPILFIMNSVQRSFSRKLNIF